MHQAACRRRRWGRVQVLDMRRGVGVELNADYARMAYNRCYQDAPLLAFAEVPYAQS